jgi:hypothetical protein
MAGGKGKSHGGKSGLKVGADGSKKQQSHSSKAGLQVTTISIFFQGVPRNSRGGSMLEFDILTPPSRVPHINNYKICSRPVEQAALRDQQIHHQEPRNPPSLPILKSATQRDSKTSKSKTCIRDPNFLLNQTSRTRFPTSSILCARKDMNYMLTTHLSSSPAVVSSVS